MRVSGLERILFASANRGKYVEVVELFAPLRIDIVYGPDVVVLDVDETGSSYASNARLKAKAYFDASGMPSLADDSGMEVRALGWEPGIFSARVAPTDGERIARILGRMRGVEDRFARYVAAFALYFPSGCCFVTEGACSGTLRETPAGVRGFGYDPIFSPSGYDCTFGELPDEVKRKISHRAVAGYRLMDILSGNCVVE